MQAGRPGAQAHWAGKAGCVLKEAKATRAEEALRDAGTDTGMPQTVGGFAQAVWPGLRGTSPPSRRPELRAARLPGRLASAQAAASSGPMGAASQKPGPVPM